MRKVLHEGWPGELFIGENFRAYMKGLGYKGGINMGMSAGMAEEKFSLDGVTVYYAHGSNKVRVSAEGSEQNIRDFQRKLIVASLDFRRALDYILSDS